MPVTNYTTRFCTKTYMPTHLTRVGNTAASVSCGRCTPNDWNPEGSDCHDEEGLGVVGCQQDAFMSVHLSMYMSVCVREKEISLDLHAC